MQMEPMLEELCDLLKQETGMYRTLLPILDREKEAAIKSELNGLNAACLEKEKMFAKIHKAGERRQRLVSDLAQKLGCVARDLRLKEITDRVGEPFGGRLSRLSNDFLSVLSQLQAANLRNRQLFEHSLALLRGSFSLLNELTSSDIVYYRTGSIQSAKATGKCVCGEI